MAGWYLPAKKARAPHFLSRDGGAWATDKDGIIPCLLAAEITARRGPDPGEIYRDLTREFGDPVCGRIEDPATPKQKTILDRLSASDIHVIEVAGEKVEQIVNAAPGDGEPIGGIKVIARNGWFAARQKRSTRFMLKASVARNTCNASKRKPKQSFLRRSHATPKQRPATEPH